MSTFLAYMEPVAGRLYPLVPALQELAGRGHRVTVRTGPAEADLLRSVGIPAGLLAPGLRSFEPRDWRAHTRFGGLVAALDDFGARAALQAPDLLQAVEAERPDVVVVDETSWGAAAAAERSGLPWAFSVPSPLPLPSRLAPPFGLGLAPRADLLGQLRDRAALHLTVETLERVIARHVNPVRAGLGLDPLHTLEDFYLSASVVLAYTDEPFEYPRDDWPPEVRLVGPGLWEPPAPPPPWLDRLRRPLVLVTCSTAFQNDGRLAEVACAAFARGPYDVVLTTADVDASRLAPSQNVHVARFVPHSPVLDRAVCVVCHGGMGVTQKALAHGVPVVAVPFGRDQPEVARRVEVARAGVRLPLRHLDPERLRGAVREAIVLRPGAERIAAAFARAGGPVAAADALETLVGASAPR